MARDYFDESKPTQKKKKEEKKTVAKTTPQSSVSNVTKKSTFLGGGASVQKTEERSSTASSTSSSSSSTSSAERERRLTQNTTAAQRQKMGMPTSKDLREAKESRRQLRTSITNAAKDALSDDNRGFMQRQKSGTQTEADKRRTEKMVERRAEVARNTGAVAKKSLQDSATGYAKTLYDVTELTAGNRNGTQALGMKMGIQDNKQMMRELEEQRRKTVEESRNRRLKLGEAQDKRQAEWDERTKNAKGLEKAWYGAVESGTGMLADTAIGAATGTGQFGALASMGLRTYGTTRGQAEKEGATEAEDRLYSLAQAGKEVGTELMFQGAGLAKRAYGGAGLSLADKAANVLTRGLTGRKADIVGAGVRLLGGTAEENAEEIAGWGLDPIIKEVTYGRKVRERAKESLLAGLPEIGSAADADRVASYFSTNKFTDDLMKEYRSSGLSEKEAKDLADEMRDMYVAYYANDQATVDRLSEDIAAKISGQSKLGKDSWSLEELGDTLASTTLLTMATGAPGAITTSVRGNAIFDSDEIKERFGENAVRKIADAVQNVSDEEMSIKAKSMLDRIDSGKDLTGTQKYDLYQGYMGKLQETAKKARASEGMTRRAMEEQNLVPTKGVDAEGNRVYAQETQRAYNEKYASAELTTEAFKDYMESDNSISDDEARRTDAVKKAVADLHVGGLTVGDAHEFAYGNTLAREVLLSEEGIDLNDYVVRNKDGSVNYAATNEATENALFTINADNAIRSAQTETAAFIDNARGDIDTDIMSRMGNSGQAVWKSVNKDLDPRNLSEYLTAANATSYFYSAGRNTDVDMNTFVSENGNIGAFRNVPDNVLKRAFAAGARDRIIANTPMYGQTVEAGSNIKMKKTKPVITGQLIVDKDVALPDSAQSAYLALAMSTNTNVHIVGSLKSSTGAEVNGMSKGNDIYLNVNAAAEQNVGYVLMHEMTHQIKQYAPNEYMALENLVRDRWFNKDAAGMQKAIKDRIDLYAKKGNQSLTEEEAMEEIIADAMAEAIDDPNFAAQVCDEDINLGQAILNSIKDALRSIRALFAESGYQNDAFHRGLLSYLDILDEAEKMWINALHSARQNKADGLIADWQDRANKQNVPRLSVPEVSDEVHEGRYSITPQQDADYMKTVESGDMRKAQSLVEDAAIASMPNIAKNPKYKTGRVPLKLYHGTPSFGFTQFKDSNYEVPFIYTSTDNTVSAHYAGDHNYASPRQIGKPYREGNSTEDIVENAKTVWDTDLKKMSTEEKKSRYNEVKEEASKVADKIDELYPGYWQADEATDNAIAWVEDLFFTIRDGDYSYNFDENDGERGVANEILDDSIRRFKDNIGKVKEYRDEHYKDLEEGPKALLNYLCGYDVGDAAIDIEYGMRRVSTEEDRLVNVGGSVSIPSDLKKALDQSRGIGAYTLYGDLGENPLEFDADGAQFWAVKVPQIGDEYMSTDQICKWAYENGYTSVIMHNIYDYGDKADNYVFFNSSQLKSADPVTYDDNGDVIPLSERFNEASPDIRFSLSEEDMASLNEEGVDLTESGSAVRYSLYSWQDTDIEALKAKLRKAGFDDMRIDKWVKDVNSIAALIAGDMTRLNYTADQFQDALKPNSEYYYTLDLSTLCQKRRLYQGTYNKIMRHLVNNVLLPEDTVRLRAMMDEMGYQVPCGICYEESRKKNEGKFAERWLNGYGKKWKGYKNQEHEDPYIPTLYEVTTTEGREKLREEHPEAYESYVNYQKTRGSANPKISYTHTDYREDILRMTENDIAKVKHIGGLRIQSFSDFEIPHVIDMMQAVMDMSAQKLTAQAYTKVPAFAKIFGGTGIKINLSLIGRWNPETEQLEFDAKEGIDPDEAFKLRDKYSKNVGTILVGSDDISILKAWADPRVDMVIPFHRSGWSKKEFEKLGLVGYKDYTKGQTERYMMGKKDMALSTASKALGLAKEEKLQPIYSADYWDENLSGKENAERYLALCAEKHYRPVFYQFLHDNGDGTWSLQEDGSTDGYWKSLIDFKMYDNDGNFAPQELVQPTFDMDEAQQIMDEYEGGADTLPVADDVVEAFLKEYKENHPNAKFDISDDARLSISVDLDEPYMDAVNSGNMEEAQRLVDEAAKMAMPNTKLQGRWYHGTENEFTEFNFSQGGKNGTADGFGIYLTNDPEVASSYGNRMIEGYVNVERPASALTTATLTKPELHRLIRRTVEIEAETLQYDGYDSLEDAKRDTWISNYVNTYSAKNLEDAIADVTDSILQFNGNDMDIIQEIMVGMGIRDYDSAMDFYDMLTEETGIDGFETKWGDESDMADPNTPTIALAFRSNQIKSADTITYAEDGSVIPLSERFDPTNNDIRYSLPTQDSDGNILTDGQMDYFKNSQARDGQGRLVPVYHSTYEGGFTIFDPSYSEDHRSLFFTNSRVMSESYISDAETGDINPYEENKKYRFITNVGELPDNFDPQNIFGIEIFGVYEGDNYLEAAAALARYAESDGWDLDDLGVNADEIYNNGPNAVNEAWELFNAAWEFDIDYQMSYEEPLGADDEMAGTYTCYLNLENPMVIDCNGAKWHSINFDGETHDTREWAEIAASDGHDGVIFRDVIDYGHSGYGSKPADVYVAFSSNQVKDVRNENPSENPDIRYSITPEDEAKSQIAYNDAMDDSYELLAYYEQQLGNVNPETFDVSKAFREEDVVKFLDSLKAEDAVPSDDAKFEEDRVRRAKSKEDFFNNVYAKWNDRWTTEGEVLKISSVKRDITNLVKGAMANSNSDAQYRNEIVRKTLLDARLAYQLMQQDRTELASYLLYHSAQRMMDGLEFIRDDTAFQEYKGIRDFLRTYRINCPDEFWENESFMDFRKEYYGRLRIGKGNSNIEDVYQDLQDRWPHLFNEEEREKADLKSKPWDLLQHIGVVVDSNVTPLMEAYSSEEATSLAYELADQLYEIIANGDREVSLADTYKERFDAKTKAMKQRHYEAILRERKIREEGIQKERQKFRAYKEAQKESKLHTKHFEGIKDKYDELTKRLLTNTKDKHIPEQYKKELAGLLKAFDFQTVGSKKREARTGYKAQNTIKLEAMRTALENIENNSQLFHINDSITDIIKDLLGQNELSPNTQSIEGKTLDELSASELTKIDKLLSALLHEFNNYEKVRVGIKKQQAADIGHAQNDISLEHAKMYGAGKDYQNSPGWIDKILNLDEITPAYLFKRIDPNKEGLGLMYGEIRKSFDKYVRNQNQLNDWMEEIVGKYHSKGILWNKYGSGELTNWRSDNYAKTFELENGTIRLTIAQMMSLSCLANRKQAYDHMVGNGVVVAPVTFNAKILSDVKGKASKALPVRLTDADIKTIVAQLTPEQKQVANKLQELMATKMAEWGNEASMNVIGIRLFEDPDYFPIRSDRGGLTKDLDPNQFEQAIRNFGFTKAVQPGAKNAIMIDDIFDVVTEHCNNMNLYNSYTEVMNDFMKVYNYREAREEGEYTVEQALKHAYSDKAATFIMQFMRDLNGNVSKRASGIEDAYNSLLGNAKKAAVFANLRVAAQQPTAITRAFAAIHPKYLKGIRIGQGDMKEMFEHCPIALWKSWGYYDINMGKSIEDIMMNNGKWLEDTATDLYGKLDNVTWTAIWQMVKAETKDTHPELKEGSDEFFEHCNERMSEIVDLTQVVDSPMHRSHAMRNKNFLVKTATSFMAEPTLTYNMIRDGWLSAKEAWERGDKKEAAKISARTMSVALLQAATVGGMAAIVDALRKKKPDKDDDDERFLHLWWVNALENFKGELELWNKIYFVKDVASIFEGWDNANLALQGIQKFALGWRQFNGDPYARSSAEWYENMADGIGYMSGIPIKTMRTGLANVMDALGLESPAVETMKERLDSLPPDKSSEVPTSGFFGKVLSDDANGKGMFGKLLTTKSDNADSETASEESFNSDVPTKESLPDNLTDEQKDEIIKSAERRAKKATPAEEEKRDYDTMLYDAMKASTGYEGEKKDKKIWESVSKGYKAYVEEGNYERINMMRRVVEEAGGDLDYFDKQVNEASKSALKKSIKSVSDMTEEEFYAQRSILGHLRQSGMSDEQIGEYVYKSETRTNLQVAMRLNDEDAIFEELTALVNAGFTQADFEKAYKNRNRVDLKNYREKNGKYADRLKSMGNFIWPTEGVITSHFGYRNAPTAGASSNHPAIDIGAPQGTAVVAADGGVVISAGANGGYGNSVGIKHDNGMITWYNHLYDWNVKEGDTVAQGQQIAQVGSTGISTGPHLDFKIMDKDGNPVDPEKYLESK